MTESPASEWYILQRWQEYASELRANLLRVVAVMGLYAVQLVHYLGFSDQSEAATRFHVQVTWIAAAWSLLALGILLCLRRRVFPPSLKYVSTGCDLVLLTLTAWLGDRAGSPLTYAYFAVLTLAALRLSLPLIWFATLGAMLGYEILVGAADPVWFDSDHATPVVQNLVMLVCLGLTGLMLGQMIRRVRALAEEYLRRMTAAATA